MRKVTLPNWGRKHVQEIDISDTREFVCIPNEMRD
jgi:hypothetical protein